ncbi:hypothetical protein [Corynebacterium glucuronolyticum]|uniref:hypothetical protein n=1 Tax=Corynebacterium glucuronolyticum TaxID=39791 RepID=UPI00223AD3C8|nr:hypothetical protein [Corynebacterium glucuronolyticum]MCT1443282.1 hypothetical protein [Corynebacterium glucuronolyticum]
MKKSDLKARPIYHRTEDSINAHITIVTAAPAVAHESADYFGMSLNELVRTLRRYRSFELEVNGQTIHATVPLPDNIQTLVNTILHPPRGALKLPKSGVPVSPISHYGFAEASFQLMSNSSSVNSINCLIRR